MFFSCCCYFFTSPRPFRVEDARGLAPRAMSTETDELRRLETCAAGSYEIGELVARGGFARCVVRHGRGTSQSSSSSHP